MEALHGWQWASFESLYFQNALVVRCIGILGSTPDYRQIGLQGGRAGGGLLKSASNIQFLERNRKNTGGELNFLRLHCSSPFSGTLGANFGRNLAAENSIAPPFHLAEQLLKQIFTAVSSIGTNFYSKEGMGVWEMGLRDWIFTKFCDSCSIVSTLTSDPMSQILVVPPGRSRVRQSTVLIPHWNPTPIWQE